MKNLIIAVELLFVAWGNAHAYETGSLTCEQIGEYAALTLAAKKAGTDYSASLVKLTEALGMDAEVERKLVTNMVTIIYQNELLVAMKPADAYAVFMRDCVSGKQQDPKR